MLIDRESNLPHATLDSFNVAISRPPAFTGGTANTRGDTAGTSNPYTLFIVTGDVLVRIFGVCTTNVAGAGTIEVGVAGNTAALIAQVANAEDIDAGDIYNDATPALKVDTLASVLGPYIIVNGADIIETVGTTDLTSGQIYYICLWRPITPESSVVGLSV